MTEPTQASPTQDPPNQVQPEKPTTEKLSTLFEPIHDWPTIYTAYKAWRQADQGPDAAFALTVGIKPNTFLQKAKAFKDQIHLESLTGDLNSGYNGGKETASAKKSPAGPAAELQAMLPDALKLVRSSLKGDKIDPSARQLAEKLLKKFGLLDQDDAPDKLSELANLSDGELEQRLAALIPQQVVAKIQTELEKNEAEKTVE